MPAISVYLSKRRAGKIIPFSRFYLVDYEDRHLIERLFPFSIVMPLNEAYLDRIAKCVPAHIVTHTREETLNDDPMDMMDAFERRERWKKLLDYEHREWVFVFPILPDGKKNFAPRSLGAQWGEGERDTVTFTDMAYLQMPGRKVRPPCLACPRYILQQAGQCKLGDPICYETLALRSAGDHGAAEDDEGNPGQTAEQLVQLTVEGR
jgi:hypothetical protein